MPDSALRSMSSAPEEDAVAFLAPGAVGAHVGLVYRADDVGTRRCLHLAWHFALRDDMDSPENARWVAPSMDCLALSNVGASARLIARRREDGRIPYAFDADDADYAVDGTLRLNRGLGLTCATFVLLVFRHAHVSLIDEQTWKTRSVERTAEDDDAQRVLVEYLMRHPDPAAEAHADRVREQVGATRIRAEEVAAATTLPTPVAFARAEPVGRILLAGLRSR